MDIRFSTQVASRLGLHEAIFLGWLVHDYDHTPTKTESLINIFSFWTDEVLYQCLAGLESQKLIQVQRTTDGNCVFALNQSQLKVQFDIELQSPSNLPNTVVTDTNLKKHLQRFQSSDSLLNKKLTQLIQQNTQELIDYAISEGLAPEIASATYDKFLHYISANPDRFWNTDLISYWRFWISNSKEKNGQGSLNAAGQGKRSAIEKNNNHATSNWLEKKAQSPHQTHSTTQISRSQNSDIKKPT
ncbi:hypothetical protein [Hydrogenovibrio kuenenii]|uniref:hypothetical protein n=1 Tax=Hydrogenovibrio kuenenii TaxID=63658 RepID=UPI000464EF9B|nr:hypothetical protein [Hydrogenovibrio kuenenii]